MGCPRCSCFHGIILAVVILLLGNVHLTSCVQEGDIRLVGGTNELEGTVLIYHSGIWGAVCDEKWDRNDARVVCRQLGYSEEQLVFTGSFFGEGEARKWMSRVGCFGIEDRLENCRFAGWGQVGCNGGQRSAGVACRPNVATPKVVSTTTATKTLTTTTTSGTTRLPASPSTTESVTVESAAGNSVSNVRLRGGGFSEEGRVEVMVSGGIGWNTLCGDTWGILEGMVICKQLGYGYAKAVSMTNIYGGEEMEKIYMQRKCTGKEEVLEDCGIGVQEDGVSCTSVSSIAGVSCAKILPDLIPNVTVLEESVHLQEKTVNSLKCAMEENCLSTSAYDIPASEWKTSVRRLMRFSSVIYNQGTDSFHTHLSKDQWEFHTCHFHYHSMDTFAHYDITDQLGNKVAEGHKASFCLEDSACDPGVKRTFRCTHLRTQGISVNCSDNYMKDVDCQWIDITDLAFGSYIFKVHVNPQLKVAELDFENNLASCDMLYTAAQLKAENCAIGPLPLSRM